MSDSITEKSAELIVNTATDAAATSTANTVADSAADTGSRSGLLSIAKTGRDWKFLAAVIVPPVVIAGLAYWYLNSSSSSSSSATGDDDDVSDPSSPKAAKNKSKNKKSKNKKKKEKDSLLKPPSQELGIDASNASLSPDLQGESDSSLALNMSEKNFAALKPLEKKKIAQHLKTTGNKLYSNKQYEQAIVHYTGALRFAEDPVFYSNRAACYDALLDYEQVIKDSNAALKLQPNYIKALMRRAKAFEAVGKLSDSLYDFTTVCIIEDFKNTLASESAERVIKNLAEKEAKEIMATRKPRIPSKSFISGYFNSYLYNGQPATPANEGDNLSQSEKDYNKALSLIETKMFAESIDILEKAIEGDIEKVNPVAAADAYSLRGAYNFLKGSLGLAKQDFDSATNLDPTHVLTMYRKANMLTEKKELENAQKLIDEALSISPKDAQGYFHSGQIHFIKMEYEASSKMYKKAIELNPNYVYPYIQSGVALFKLGQVAAAMEIFNSAKARFPHRSDLFNYYGEVLAEQGGTADATKAFEKSIEIDSTNPLPYVNKALTMFQTSANFELAFSLIKQALEVDPECELAVAALSQVYLQLGMFDDSLRMLRRAVQLAKSEEELISTITFRETTSAQYRFITEHPEMISKLSGY